MSKTICSTCQKPKATLECGLCHDPVCKYCAQILDEDCFSYLPVIPADLQHSVYCNSCFDQKVSADFTAYNQTMEDAKEVLVFFDTQGKETRLIKRLEETVHVYDCPDRDETIMRLAFFAAKAGYNGIIDLAISSKKIKNGNHTTLSWQASAIPAHINDDKLLKDRALWQNPN